MCLFRSCDWSFDWAPQLKQQPNHPEFLWPLLVRESFIVYSQFYFMTHVTLQISIQSIILKVHNCVPCAPPASFVYCFHLVFSSSAQTCSLLYASIVFFFFPARSRLYSGCLQGDVDDIQFGIVCFEAILIDNKKRNQPCKTCVACEAQKWVPVTGNRSLSVLKINPFTYVSQCGMLLQHLNICCAEHLDSRLTQDGCIFVTWLVIMVFTSWALSNKICLHMISTHMMTWGTFGSWQQYCPCCPEKNYVLFASTPRSCFVFFQSYGKTTKINITAVGLHFQTC